ncbi:MAG: UDP-N-acetylglucosamine 2-epimerase (non-hydrolyzing) [Cellvibrionales bacterium]|nr:MAG: UDP-N-acetylglucosamine 2-epimerase (non-hydrolyzing) [Cellvibrionales bacterium]
MSKSTEKKILCIVGARPNFMKIAPVIRALNNAQHSFNVRLLHTGQHYDAAMKQSFFDQLHIPEPDVDLGVGSGSHAVQTAEIMKRFEPVMDELKPDTILVVGDVNSTIACALVAVKKGVPVIHVEAGLRSGDRSMPEEINRVLTDQISDLLLTTERSAEENLLREGISAEKVHFVGNVMIDTLRYNLSNAVSSEETVSSCQIAVDTSLGYGLLTLHRPANVDDPVVLERLLRTLVDLAEHLPLLFPVHPRTRQCIESSGLNQLVADSQLHLIPPQAYLNMLGLMKDARLVLTDSGGIQEETTALGVPCITLRENTERPITVAEGSNIIVGSSPEKIKSCFDDIMQSGGKAGRIPEYWDGKAAERIAKVIGNWLNKT